MRKSDIILLCAILCGALLVLGICGSLMLGKLRHEMIEFLLGGMLLYSGLALLL